MPRRSPRTTAKAYPATDASVAWPNVGDSATSALSHHGMAAFRRSGRRANQTRCMRRRDIRQSEDDDVFFRWQTRLALLMISGPASLPSTQDATTTLDSNYAAIL